MLSALRQFADAIHRKFSVHVSGEPEDQLRAPFEQLLSAAGEQIGVAVVAIGETLLDNHGGKPDFGVSANKLLCGHVELKAPGKGADTTAFTGHDKKQWERFSNLPNILYSDGREFALYRAGKQERLLRLDGDPRSKGASAVTAENAQRFNALIRDFLAWEPVVPRSAAELAQYLAPLTRILRDDVRDALRLKAPGVVDAAADWRRYLFPGADDARFADAYAQTVTFSLLLARSNGSDTLFLDEAIASLTHANSLLSRALQVLTDPLVKEHLSTSLGLLQRVINAVPTGTMSGGRRDPWLHFYEDFLSEYDPVLRKDAGAYYTPVEVVQAQVRLIDDLLRQRMNKPMGFATGGVNVLDPAVGTGTYLLGIAEHALALVAEQEGPGSVPARADLLAGTLYGFEIMVGPYAVAALRLTRMLQDRGGHVPGDGVQVMLTNTLESPHEKIPELPLLYQPIGLEHKRAKRVKDTVPILVCLGNPPYDRHAAATEDNKAMTGGWVRWGESKNGRDAILNDFIEPVKAAGHGGDLKNLYNLYVYFWRWALWKTFEHILATGPGVVSYISASSFIDGDAFLGMRRWMRKQCDSIFVIDLGGEGRGTRKDDNVFAIQTPVAITVAVRYGGPQPDTSARTFYARIEGSRAAKLEKLESLHSLADLVFEECPSDWDAPFRPAGKGAYFDLPLLTDLMPWQHSGVEAKRTWPMAPDEETLVRRWRTLLSSRDRRVAFRESTDRLISETYAQFSEFRNGQIAIADLPEDAPPPPIRHFAFRFLDREFVFADSRMLARPRPQLWSSASNSQLYFASLFNHELGGGPALVVSAEIPDRHVFRGSFGGKDILPLWRDAAATQPNLHPGLLALLQQTWGAQVTAEDVAAYIYAVLAQPAFTDRFNAELATRELRVPITTDHVLFRQAAGLGRTLLWLHSYGERFAERQPVLAPLAKCLKGVPAGALPEKFAYDAARHVIDVGGGEFGPVPPEVWNYEVSGLKVVQSWLGYRMKNRKGKKSSPLDDITPKEWSSEYTSEFLRLLNLLIHTLTLQPQQSALLDAILAGPLLPASALAPVPEQWRAAPSINASGRLVD
ncbi:MAG TPA: type ISP restriction/modification enzyme [Rhodanobacteraceae bacterium]|nr:type ISP restriction/modification enzyme [Rhodanobacteraceae bacterium]